jgi:hypothetical protein
MQRTIVKVMLLDLLIVLPLLMLMTIDLTLSFLSIVVVPGLIMGNVITAFILFLRGKDHATVYWLNSIVSPAIYIGLYHLWFTYIR